MFETKAGNGHCGGGRKRAAGFTMLEMMIIIVIIGIVAAMAVPSFYNTIPRLKARTEARNILNFVRLARSRAVSDGSQYGVYIDTSNRQYILFKDTINPAQMMYNTGDSAVVGPETLDPDVVLTNSTFTNNTVVFIPTGGASQSGSFTLDNTDGGSSYTVSVLSSTGKSKLQ
jgi:type II secretion system protein H